MAVNTSLRMHVARSAAWSAVQIAGNQVTAFAVFLVLARLLPAEAIGLVAVSTSFIELITPLMRGGLPEALIQSEGSSEIQADTCFWSNLLASLALAAAILVCAPLAGNLFGLPMLAPVLRVLSVMLPIGALTATHEARLTREFGFKALAVRGIVANVLSGACGISLALAGAGVWSLVAQRLLFCAASTLMTWKAFPWIPRLRVSASELRKMIRFGVPMIASGFLGTLNSRIMDLLLGYFLGAAAVGHVRVASRCLEMVTQFTMAPLTSIALPTFSRLQSDRAAFSRAFRRMVQVSGTFTFPAYFGLAVIAADLVPLVFGAKWRLSGSLLPIMCLGAMPMTLQFFTWPALAAVGRSDRSALGILVVVVASAIAIAVGANFGVRAAVVANVLRSYLTLPFTLMLLSRYTGVRRWPLVSSTLLPCLGAMVMAGTVYFVGNLLDTRSASARIAVMIAVGVVTFAGFMLAFGRDLVLQLRGVIRREA